MPPILTDRVRPATGIGGVLLTGGSGLLALNWAMALRDRAPVTLALHRRPVSLAGVGTSFVSLETAESVLRSLDVLRPALVVHAAGLTSVEACEANEALAYHVNVESAENVADACARLGLPLVHVSTDHLFRGDHALVTESQPVDPQNAYGRTKATAERRVMAIHPNALVIRTNFFGWGPRHRRSFSDTILDTLRRRSPITLFEDAYYTPILAEVLSLAVHDLVDVRANGIVHLSGDERVSKYEFGLRLSAQFGLDASLIRAGRLADRVSLVRRPLDMSLSNARIRGLLGRGLGGVHDHLTRLHEQERRGVARELMNS